MASGAGAQSQTGAGVVSAADADRAMFAKALKALQPYLAELVVIGGWAHRLFGMHPGARAPGFQPLMTEDADIAAPVRIQHKGESIAALLKRSTSTTRYSFFPQPG